MSYRYKKAPAWVGKDLVIYVGGADRRIHDSEILIGPHFGKFVGMGFLVEAKDQSAEEPAQPSAPAPKAAQVPAQPGMTRSTAAKLADSGVAGGGAKPKGPAGGAKPKEPAAPKPPKAVKAPEPPKEERAAESAPDPVVSTDEGESGTGEGVAPEGAGDKTNE